MANLSNIYLFYFKEFTEPDTWDFKFSYFFSLLLSQVLGPDVKIYSNLDVSGTRILKTSEIDTANFDAFVIIQNSIDQLRGTIDSISELKGTLDNFPNEKIFQVIKKGKVNQIDGGIYTNYAQYKFFELNHRSFQITEFDPDIHGDSEVGFWEKLSDLVYDIKTLTGRNIENQKRENTIYLAEVSDDQSRNRERVKRELLLLGYRVLPLSPLPRKLDEFENAVTALLYESIISINILGEMYGDAPQMSDYSYVEIQNKTFEKEFLTQKKLPVEPKIARVLWTQPVMEYFDEKQVQYMKRLQYNTFQQQNTDFVQSTVSELIEIIQKKVKQIRLEGFEFINEANELNFYIIIDNLEKELEDVLKSKFDKERISYQIHGKEEIKDLSQLLLKFKHQHNFLIINTSKPASWTSSLLSLISRSKGLPGAMPLSSLILLGNDVERDYSYLAPIDIELIPFRPYKFDEHIDSIISKIKA